LVELAGWPDACVGIFDQRLVVSSPISTNFQSTHLGMRLSSIGMLANWTGSGVGFFILFLLMQISVSYGDKPYIGYPVFPVTFVENHSHCDLMESMTYRVRVGVSDVSDVYLSYFKNK
jgi:hypothetical protein